jgi:hypothetical protein
VRDYSELLRGKALGHSPDNLNLFENVGKKCERARNLPVISQERELTSKEGKAQESIGKLPGSKIPENFERTFAGNKALKPSKFPYCLHYPQS